MPLEQAELNQILETVKKTTQETLIALKQQEKKTEEEIAKEKRTEEALTKVNELSTQVTSLTETTGKIKSFCDTYPELCKTVQEIKQKLETPPPAPAGAPKEPPKPEPPKEKILGTDHTSLEELLSCPECLAGHIKKVGFEKAAEQICKNDEACKATLAELTKKGYKIGEPPKPEPPKEPSKEKEDDKGKTEETTNPEGHFTLGKGAKA